MGLLGFPRPAPNPGRTEIRDLHIRVVGMASDPSATFKVTAAIETDMLAYESDDSCL